MTITTSSNHELQLCRFVPGYVYSLREKHLVRFVQVTETGYAFIYCKDEKRVLKKLIYRIKNRKVRPNDKGIHVFLSIEMANSIKTIPQAKELGI